MRVLLKILSFIFIILGGCLVFIGSVASLDTYGGGSPGLGAAIGGGIYMAFGLILYIINNKPHE